MNLRRVTVFGVEIVLLAMIAALCSVPKEDSPKVNGRPISKWLRSAQVREVGPVAEAGTNAIPFLVRLLRAHEVIPYRWSIKAWFALPSVLQRHVPQPVEARELRVRALDGLSGFGPEAEAAFAVVLAAATNDADPMVGIRARQAALAIDPNHPQVWALLEEDLRSHDPVVRSTALAPFWNLSLSPRPVTNLIILDPHDRNQVYLNELMALASLGPDIAPFVPRIVGFLSDNSARLNALIALQRAGPGAAAAVPALINCLRAPEGLCRSKAAEILKGIGPPAKDAVPALEAAMRDKELVTRVMAAAARWRITGDPVPSAPVILDALQESDDGSSWNPPQGAFGLRNMGFNARQTALWFAGELGPLARESLPVLVKRMETSSDWYRVLAARSVWKVEGLPDRSLPVLRLFFNSFG